MRVFITGASGFLGGHLLDALGRHEVLCLVRSRESAERLCSAARPHVRTVVGDLGRSGTWFPALESFAADSCVHLAWDGLPDYSLGRCRQNLDLGLGLLETLTRARVRRLVVAGSCWEYGAAVGAVKEDVVPVDCGVFASTKNAFRTILESVARDQGMEWRWARTFFVYGPGQRTTSLVPSCHADYARGRVPQVRNPSVAQDFIYVDDVAQALLALSEEDVASGVYNVGSGEPTSVAAVVNRVAAHFEAPRPFADEDFETGFWADIEKLSRASGWRPRTPLKRGIDVSLAALDRQS